MWTLRSLIISTIVVVLIQEHQVTSLSTTRNYVSYLTSAYRSQGLPIKTPELPFTRSIRLYSKEDDDLLEAEKVLEEAELAIESTSLELNLRLKEDYAKQLTEYMAKAHQQKIEAVAAAEKGLKQRITELDLEVKSLKETIQSLESKSPKPIMSSNGSYEMPLTNKAMIEKVETYQKFISDYLVNSLIEKQEAVAKAEKMVHEKYKRK